jgi:hypothetical protein
MRNISRLNSTAAPGSQHRPARRELKRRRRLAKKSTTPPLARLGRLTRKRGGRAEGCASRSVLRKAPPKSVHENERKSDAISSRLLEQAWLQQHHAEYAGIWVALEGSALIAQGSSAREVLDAAKLKGYQQPLVVRLPSGPPLPFGGW